MDTLEPKCSKLARSLKTQTVTLSPNPLVIVSVNQSLTFTCTTTYSVRYIFFRDSTLPSGTTAITLQVTNDSCTKLTGRNAYNFECDIAKGSFIFTIHSITRQHHNSNITCKIQYGDNTSLDVAYAVTTILVNAPLVITELTPSGKVTKNESDTLSFKCSVSGFPIADVSWLIDGSAPTTQSPPIKVSSVVSASVTSEVSFVAQKIDNGKLMTCSASNANEQISNSTELVIQYRPIVTISPNNDPYRVLENTTLQLRCNVIDTNPSVTSFIWTKDNYPLSNKAAYIILKVNRSHAGRYLCGAVNNAGKSDPDAFMRLEVLYGIEITPISENKPAEGNQLNVICKGQSNPELKDDDVTWTKQKNNTFSSKGKQLLIQNVNKVDSGIYICSAVIKITPTDGLPQNLTGRTTVDVDVLYRPNVTISPRYTQFTATENTTNLEFKCTVGDANPQLATFRWYKNDFIIDGSTDASYTISTVRRSNTGSYKCDATNSVGSSDPSSDIQLDVLYGIQLNPISKNNPTEGNTLTITCSGQSYPVMTSNDVKWSKQNNDTFHRKGPQLVIDHVYRSDSGTYVCFVLIQLTPTVGKHVNVTGTTTVEVDVLYRPHVAISPDKNPYIVIENTTNLNLMCNVTASNPAVSSYVWHKDGVKVSTNAIYRIPIVYRIHTGRYTCEATNSVGRSDRSHDLQLDVRYGVSLKLSGTNISLNESESWELSCIGDGNPLPKIMFMYVHNSTTVGEQKGNTTYINVDNANCMDTGLYICSGNNTLGEPVSQTAEIKVECKPRSYNNLENQDIFINGAHESLNLSATFISFPLSKISWSRQLQDGNSTNLGSEFKPSIISSKLPYERISILQKDQLKQNEFGIYLVKATNNHGSFLFKYNVIPKRAPDMPTNITASCEMTTINVTWVAGFNGGVNQTFRISFADNISNQTMFKEKMANRRDNENMNVVTESVSPDTLYIIFLEAYNLYGTTKSTEITNCTTQKDQEQDQRLTSALVGGIVGSISALLTIVIVIGGLYCHRRGTFHGGNKELMKRESIETDDDEDGLKDNPLYATSGEVSNSEQGPVYGVVNKLKKNKENVCFDDKKDQGQVYAEVQRSSPHEEGPLYGVVNKPKHNQETGDSDNKKSQGPVQVQKSGKHGKKRQKKITKKEATKNENNTDIELGTIYENSDKTFKHTDSDELYANAGEQDDVKILPIPYTPKKNKDGLIYADVDLLPGPSGNRFVIRGHENRTNYAIIDLSKKAEPLPSDNEDEDNDNTYSN